MKEIYRISITDAVVDNLKEMIESGQYKIDTKLPTECSLCDELKVSRTSVREAMRVLQALGYVDLRPGKGAFVADYTKRVASKNWYEVEDAKFYDFMEVRLAIEALAVRLSVEKATPKQIKELDAIHESFLEASAAADLVRLIMLDELFHTKIVSYACNQLLININKQLLDSFCVYRGDSFTNNEVYINAVEPHSRILECFHEKNASRAVREIRLHLEITTADMEKIHNKK